MIKINKLRLSYKNNFTLNINRLTIKEGEIFSIIGPNGAGKTTLLNVLNLLEKPQQGQIKIFNKNILEQKNALSFRRRIAHVFSRPYLFNNTVYKNVSVPLSLRREKYETRVDEILRLFKIFDLKNENALTLSQGQMHRVSLARAFVSNPELILMDEPFISLEKPYKESLMVEIRQIIKKRKITALFVSQEQDEVLRLADRIAVMKEGKILEIGTPHQIFTKPAKKEVADFIGIETVAEGIIYKKQDNLCSVRVKNKVIEAISEYNVMDTVFVLIRPEDVVFSKHKEKTSARNSFKAKITNIEPYGLEYKITFNCGFNMLAFITKQSIDELGLKKKKKVYISFKATAVHLIKR
ncbi:MAG: ABC transporter ATP-binding protein [Candidatus Firestonebacteria bacterium]